MPVVVESIPGLQGQEWTRITITNPLGMKAQIINYGATLTHLFVPDQDGVARDVVLGFDDPTMYASDKNKYFGGCVGRVANRIRNGKFELNGKAYQLSVNNGPNHLHGGSSGFSHRLWDVSVDHVKNECTLSVISEDGDQGYPGRLHAKVRYLLPQNQNTLAISLFARTESDTIVNLTNHTYFNLSGGIDKTVQDSHTVQMSGDIIGHLELDETSIPTGKVLPLTGKYDFINPRTLKEDYDDYFVSPIPQTPSIYFLASLKCESTGIEMLVTSMSPGFQLYNAVYCDQDEGSKPYKTSQMGLTYGKHSGVCFETQYLPDAINHPKKEWRDAVILRPREHFMALTVFTFLTK